MNHETHTSLAEGSMSISEIRKLLSGLTSQKPIPQEHINEIRRKCLDDALQAASTWEGRITGVYRDIQALIRADEQSALSERLKNRPDTTGPMYGRDEPSKNGWTGD